jgi:Tfp pilus assembly protein PilN
MKARIAHPATWVSVSPVVSCLVFSVAWFIALLIVTQFRLMWLCLAAAVLLGFLTDCVVDILQARNHQRRMRAQFLEHEREYKSPRTDAEGAAR